MNKQKVAVELVRLAKDIMAREKVEHFEIDGEQYRVRGLGDDSGVMDTRKEGMEKWVLEFEVRPRHWERDSAIYLPNGSSMSKAKRRFGV